MGLIANARKSRARVTRFEAIDADRRRTDLSNRLQIGDRQADAAVSFDRPGSYVLLLETDKLAESHLPAGQFNDYLRREGLTPAIEARKRAGSMAKDGAESYSRHAKTVIQVGDVDPLAQGQIVRRHGLELEIVPDRSPLTLQPAAPFAVRVFYRGRILPGALVKLTELAHDAEPIEIRRTDAKGRATFSIPAAGDWLLNVIWTRPQARSSLADFRTSFSSLSFRIAK